MIRLLALVATVALFGIVLALFMLGLGAFSLTTVRDAGGYVARAELVGHGWRSEMWHVTGGQWIGSQDGDGTIRLTCKDGRVIERAYVTRLMHTSYTVTAQDCGTTVARLAEAP